VKAQEIETKFKQMAAEIEELKSRMQKTEDIEAIKKLHRAYGYYTRTLAGRRDRRTLFPQPGGLGRNHTAPASIKAGTPSKKAIVLPITTPLTARKKTAP